MEVNRDMVVKVGTGRYRVRIVYNKKGYQCLSLLGSFRYIVTHSQDRDSHHCVEVIPCLVDVWSQMIVKEPNKGVR